MRVLEQVGFEMVGMPRMSNAAPVEGGGPSKAVHVHYTDYLKYSIRFRSFAAL